MTAHPSNIPTAPDDAPAASTVALAAPAARTATVNRSPNEPEHAPDNESPAGEQTPKRGKSERPRRR